MSNVWVCVNHISIKPACQCSLADMIFAIRAMLQLEWAAVRMMSTTHTNCHAIVSIIYEWWPRRGGERKMNWAATLINFIRLGDGTKPNQMHVSISDESLRWVLLAHLCMSSSRPEQGSHCCWRWQVDAIRRWQIRFVSNDNSISQFDGEWRPVFVIELKWLFNSANNISLKEQVFEIFSDIYQ